MPKAKRRPGRLSRGIIKIPKRPNRMGIVKNRMRIVKKKPRKTKVR